MMLNGENKSSQDYQLFIKLYLANERRIYGYVRALIPSWNDVDDIIQESASVMWSKFDQFEKGTNFSAWALKIAHNQVLNYCKVRKKNRLYFNESTLESIAHKSQTDVQNTDERLSILRKCLQKLQAAELSLIQMRYEPGGSIKNVSQQTGKNPHVLYRQFNKIHAKLLMCIRRTIAEGGLA
ncbi:MAG: sigma-70 family RNA polymerase sigma factor [Planctomycetaceae bacterium]|nr:sigma-70 family RNA polymerase sigma factor [Planctomycetaceae bacterium]